MPVQVARPLVYELPTSPAAAGAAVSQVAQQHAQHVSCIYSVQGNQSLCQPAQPPTDQQQQQQQQRGWLDPAEFPWLQPALQSAVQRLQPRLDLLTWQSWQSVELPLPGGVLLVGGSEGGRAWLLQLLGQEAAALHGAHVLKVGLGDGAGQTTAPCAVPCCAVLCCLKYIRPTGWVQPPAAPSVSAQARRCSCTCCSHCLPADYYTGCCIMRPHYLSPAPCLCPPPPALRFPARAWPVSPTRLLPLCWHLLRPRRWPAAPACCCWMILSC